MQALGIDIGGSGIKGSPVDLSVGDLMADRFRLETPERSTPQAVIEIARKVVEHHGWHGPIGVALPSVVIHGTVLTAANIHDDWIGFDAQAAFSEALGDSVTVVNDADAAGLAEAAFGAAKGRSGVTIVLTFGTGIGSAMINDGRLMPNTEFGHLEFRGMEAEHYAAAKLVERENMDVDWWARRVNEFLQHIDRIFSPDTIVFGGGISKRFSDFSEFFETRALVVPATLRNNAGIVGAAMVAAGEGTT